MKFPLKIPAGAKQQNFLDYLNAAIRSRMGGAYSGSYRVEDGVFYSTLVGPFRVDQDHFALEWRVTQDRDGTLVEISVSSVDSTDSETTWTTSVSEFVTSVLATTVAGTKKSYFHRTSYFYVGPHLDGEYWLPGYRFAPLIPDDEMPSLINAERIIVIDQKIEAIDSAHAGMIANEAAARHAARLSLLLNIGLYVPGPEMRWTHHVGPEGDGPMNARRFTGFNASAYHITEMPKKGDLCSLGEYKGRLTSPYRAAGDLISLPPEARKILRGIEHATPVVTKAFDRCARLYQVALVCGSIFPSVGLAYRIAAVEAISEADPTCKGFSEFMRRYVTSRSDLDPILDYLYRQARSAHLHAGKFPLGEFSQGKWFSAIKDWGTVAAESVHRIGFEISREAVVNWMLAQVPGRDGTG